ncbi:MAG: Dipeptide transport system permease protein DppB [Phycisphaerae bacterium]|nr:Dipeptide transport system permease protein DppB [Phycisphaerae bacterium]
MLAFVLRRILLVVPALLGVSTLIFLIVRLTPRDPAEIMLGERGTRAQLAEIRRINGWDRPLHEQYFRFLYQTFIRFDLGRAYTRGDERVVDGIASAMPATIELTIAAMLIATLVGVPAGILAGMNRRSWFDVGLMSLSTVGISIPVFFLGLVLIVVFRSMPSGGQLDAVFDPEEIGVRYFVLLGTLWHGVWASWLGGACPVAAEWGAHDHWEMFIDALRHIVLPSCALATVPMAVIARVTRSSMLEVLNTDYVRTARAKGVSRFRVVTHHALRNALVQVVTILGLQFGILLAGAVLTETVFAWPGIGRYTVEVVRRSDYNAIQGSVLVIATMFLLVNLLVDVSYGLLDPRIRQGARR